MKTFSFAALLQLFSGDLGNSIHDWFLFELISSGFIDISWVYSQASSGVWKWLLYDFLAY